MKRKLIWVQWRDARVQQVYFSKGDLLNTLATVESSGFLVETNNEALIIAADWNDEWQQWRGITGIPIECVIRKKIVTVDL